MKVYLVTYDNDIPDMRRLCNELQRCIDWYHCVDNTWLVKTDESAHELYNRLLVHIGIYTNLLIITIGSEYDGHLPHEVLEWIEKAIIEIQL